jgi:anti-sigma regulatory factor (Ser/Thr protein kinase)
MTAQRGASTNGRAALVEDRTSGPSELDRLRTTCRRQASVIDTLGEAIAVLRTGASALKAENAELRATGQPIRHRHARSPARPAAQAPDVTEVRLPLDATAPAAARAAVAARLRHRWTGPAFDRAELVASELVTNGVVHSDPSAEAVLAFRLELSEHAVRIEVEDPGRRGVVAPRPPDLDGGGGFGLQLVQQLSERWGLERVATGGTRVWAYVALAVRPPHSSITS